MLNYGVSLPDATVDVDATAVIGLTGDNFDSTAIPVRKMNFSILHNADLVGFPVIVPGSAINSLKSTITYSIISDGTFNNVDILNIVVDFKHNVYINDGELLKITVYGKAFGYTPLTFSNAEFEWDSSSADDVWTSNGSVDVI